MESNTLNHMNTITIVPSGEEFVVTYWIGSDKRETLFVSSAGAVNGAVNAMQRRHGSAEVYQAHDSEPV